MRSILAFVEHDTAMQLNRKFHRRSEIPGGRERERNPTDAPVTRVILALRLMSNSQSIFSEIFSFGLIILAVAYTPRQ